MYRLRANIKTAILTVKNITMSLNKPTYTTAAGQLEHQLTMMSLDEELLETFRTKRFLCEWCGKLQHSVYGLMDAESARNYDTKINDNINAIQDNRELIRNQSEIFQTALNFNKNTFGRLERKINEFAESTNNQTDKLNFIQLEVNENTLIQYTQLLITEYYRLLGQIRRTLTNTRNGQLMEIIPKTQLAADLKLLNGRLEPNQQLPIDLTHEDVTHIFKFTEVKSTLHKHKIIIEIGIPIVERERCHLYKVIPIPIRINNTSVIASVHSNYFLMNEEQTKYIPMNQKQLDGGKKMSDNEILYRPTVTTLLTSDGICEWQVLRNGLPLDIQVACQFTPFLQQNILITIVENELIFVTANRNQTVFENCNTTELTQRKISGRGTITIDPNCLFKTDHYIVRPHKTKTANGSQIILPSIPLNEINWNNITLDIFEKLQPKYVTGLTVIQNADELQRIMERTKNLVKNADHELKLSEIHYNTASTSWFSGMVSALSIFGVGAGIITTIFYKCNLLNCILRSIIKRSTDVQVEHDGTVSLGLSSKIMPKIEMNRPLHNQLNKQLEYNSTQSINRLESTQNTYDSNPAYSINMAYQQ